MQCEHAQSTTLLWLYGEADDAHALHVAGCDACAAVAAEHASVTSALGPALAAISAGALSEPPIPAPRRRPRIQRIVAWAAVLAAGALWTLSAAPPADSPPEPDDAVAFAPPPRLNASDPFDAALDDLDREIERLSLELEQL